MLLCCDLDGTFYRRGDAEGLRVNLVAVKRWREAGHKFVLVTGRNLSRMVNVPITWREVVDYLVTDNGAAIFNRFAMLETPFECLDEEEVERIMSLLTSEMTPIFYYMDFYRTMRDPLEVVFKVRLWYRTAEALWRHKRILEENGVKVLPCSCPTESELEGENAEGFLDVVSCRASKARAVQAVMEKCGYERDEVIVVGNGCNDLEMLEQFQSYAMVDAEPQAMQAAQGRKTKSVASLIDDLMKTAAIE